MELHLHPTVFVGIDFFACRAGDDCRLRACGVRLGRCTLAAIGNRFRHHIEADAIRRRTVGARALSRAGATGTIASAHVFFKAVVGRLDQIFLVLVVAQIFGECEQITWSDVARVALALGQFAAGFLLFDAHAGVVFSVARVGITARPVVEFAAVFGMACGLLLLRFQQRLGFLEIIVVACEMAGRDVFGEAPTVDEILVVHMRRALAGVVGDGGRAVRQRAVAADVISQHQLVTALAVFKEEVAPLKLKQARDKIEVRLAVLHHVVPATVMARELVLDGEAVGAQHFLDDVGSLLELEDLEVGAPRRMPQPGAQHGLVAEVVAIATNVSELRHLPREKALAATCRFGGEIDLDAHVLAEQPLRGDRRTRADQPHAIFEQTGNLLASLQRAELQLITHWAVGDEGAIRHE
ncbi:hypothetical protein SDC9_68904 [bioreactor metagenome]|uniref:Uncharacterized protein n=1 Tax=bioreactor metagenome TaxID=1076179 RepID=A0A644Y270_9ZZZZ